MACYVSVVVILIAASCSGGNSRKPAGSAEPNRASPCTSREEFAAEENTLNVIDVETGKVRWGRKLQVLHDSMVSRALVITGEIDAASDEVIVRAWGRRGGQAEWAVRPDIGAGDVSIIAAGAAILVRVACDEGSVLLSLEGSTGVEHWRNEFLGVTEGPFVVGDIAVIVLNSLQEVVGIDVTSGVTRWKRTFPESPYLSTSTGESVLVAFGERKLIALDPADGTNLWVTLTKDEALDDVQSTHDQIYTVGFPVLEQGLEGKVIRAFDARNGQELWALSRPLLFLEQRVAASDPLLFLETAEAMEGPYRTEAIDPNTGSVRWRASHGLPVTAGSHVFLATNRREILILRSDTGTVVRSVPFGGRVADFAAVDGHRIYVANTRGDVAAITAEGILWRSRVPGGVYQSPIVMGNDLFVLSGE